MPKRKPQPKQTTEKGLEIPVPKRSDFFDNLKKLSRKQKGTEPPPKK